MNPPPSFDPHENTPPVRHRAKDNLPIPHKARLGILIVLIVMMFSALWVRLLHLSLQPQEGLPTAPAPQYPRGDILDRNGEILAGTLETYSLYAHPHMIQDKAEAAQALCCVLPHLHYEKIYTALSSSKNFVWLARNVTPERYKAVETLGLPGIEAHKTYKRIYTHGPLFCHVLGMTDIDQVGISGLEKYFHPLLHRGGQPIYTSLDVRLQHIVRTTLSQAIERFHAVGGNGILVNMTTGEVLAMVSLPDFDGNQGAPQNEHARFHRNTTGVYEFGSIMKIVNAALFLESGAGSLQTRFDASHALRIGRFAIKDFQGRGGHMSVEEGFLHSSNIVNAQMAWMVGPIAQKAFFNKLGFFQPVCIELKEAARTLMPTSFASKSTMATAAFGHGFAVTPLHVVQGLGSLAAGKKLHLTLLSSKHYTAPQHALRSHTCIPQAESAPFIRPATRKAILYLMEQAVLRGKVRKAWASNCSLGAKTGTANYQVRGRYIQGKNLTSCVAVFPAAQPQYILLITIDQPKACAETFGYATAGWFAAPTLSTIVQHIAPLLGLLNYPPQPLGKNL